MKTTIEVIMKWKEYRNKVRWNSKGQTTTPITIMFLVLFFMVIWALFLGGFINMNSAIAIADHHLGGFEGFLWANLNLIIFICLIVFILAFKYITVG